MSDPRVAADNGVRHVGILGAGTAGYLTAMALKKRVPTLAVTIVQSSRIPIIGVGEATTPLMVSFLHGVLGVDVSQLYAEVAPTWKLGIRFEWGKPPPYFFNYPFDSGEIGDAQHYDGNINRASLLASLMAHGRGPVFRTDDEDVSMLDRAPFAYHLDNRRFVAFLQRQAAELGVEELDREIIDVHVDGDRVHHLVTSDGEQLRFDLYVDCSGFASRLMGQAMGSRFISFGDSLFTDRALVSTMPHAGVIKPYTTATTMDNGWCWNIPQMDEDHIGYVFSSHHATEEEARRELAERFPSSTEPHLVRFRSGRHEHFWRGNVVAVGNAYGFVEPLESTGLQMIIIEALALANSFPADLDRSEATARRLSRSMGDQWDALRSFLAVHYRFNRRVSSPFWDACNHTVELHGASDVVAEFRAKAPLTYRGVRVSSDLVFNTYGYDVLLHGQGVATASPLTRSTRTEWAEWCELCDQLTASAHPHAACLDLVQRGGRDALHDYAHGEHSWVRDQAEALDRGEQIEGF